MEKDVVIDIKNLTKVYNLYESKRDRVKEAFNFFGKKYSKDFYALNDVSFSIKKGETVGIVGKNGAGKSTLLKIITGVLNPTRGTVVVNGKIAALLELGAGFNPEMTGIENIYLSGTLMGFSKEEMDLKVDSIVRFADIGDFINQPVKMYSSGMFARLAFAVNINVQPDILIVDEALSVGDVFFQSKCYKKFNELKENGTTILFVTHSLGTIVEYCDHAILMDQGVKISEGNPKAIVDLYKQIMVGCNVQDNKSNISSDSGLDSLKADVVMKHEMIINPDALIYGNGLGEISDFGIIDENGKITNMIDKGTFFKVKFVAKFNTYIESPIFAFTILNKQGVDLCGTNTMLENKVVPFVNEGDIKTVIFNQRMDLQGGDYLLSLGLTGFHEGEFTVYQRLYDICSITVISQKNSVGVYDMNSAITLE